MRRKKGGKLRVDSVRTRGGGRNDYSEGMRAHSFALCSCGGGEAGGVGETRGGRSRIACFV